MSASNKLIFSLEQNLDINEKNRARKNIGAVAAIRQVTQDESITLTNDQAQRGRIEVPLDNHDIGTYLLNVELYATTSSSISDQRVPIRLYFQYSNALASATEWTSALERLNSNSPWYAGLSMLPSSTITQHTVKNLVVYWEPLKIQAGVTIRLTIEYILLSETEPS